LFEISHNYKFKMKWSDVLWNILIMNYMGNNTNYM
jgi:hypothetical protein